MQDILDHGFVYGMSSKGMTNTVMTGTVESLCQVDHQDA